MSEYRSIVVEKGSNGWGGPVEVRPTDEKKYIVSMTGMVIHKVAKEIAKLTGAELVNGYKKPVAADKMACIVIDCGGVARCHTFPGMGVPTIQVYPLAPSGPGASKMVPELFVSDVKPSCLKVID